VAILELSSKSSKIGKPTMIFRVLQTLNLESVIEHEALELLASIAFPSLRGLKLHLREYNSNLLNDEYLDLGEQFLHKLQPLSEIEILGEIRWMSFDLIIDRHGSALRKLRLLPGEPPYSRDRGQLISQSNIKQLAAQSPLLEELAIATSRTKGDEFEVKTYKLLGSILRLKRLSLRLNPGRPPFLRASEIFVDMALLGVGGARLQLPTNPSFDHFDRQICSAHGGYRNGHVKDIMINSAVDSTLARAIFNVISSGKPAGALRLESLEVEVRPEGALATAPFFSVLCALGLSWKVERSLRDDASDELITKELQVGRREREEATAWNMGKWGLEEPWNRIFRRIWPAKEETWDSCYEWRQDWHSFPLCDSDN
jgi:hypothetical protein